MTGGNWQSVTHRNGVILVGHLRLPVEVATKMMSRSGQLAVFLAVLPCKHHIPKKVVWIPKKPGLNEGSYWVYCKEQSIAKDLALAFRQGGGADVGLIDGKATAKILIFRPRVSSSSSFKGPPVTGKPTKLTSS